MSIADIISVSVSRMFNDSSISGVAGSSGVPLSDTLSIIRSSCPPPLFTTIIESKISKDIILSSGLVASAFLESISLLRIAFDEAAFGFVNTSFNSDI